MIDFKNVEEAYNKLLNNEINAIVAETPTLRAQISHLGLEGAFTLASKVFTSNAVHAAFTKGQTTLLTQINKGIDNIPANELIALESKWFPKQNRFTQSGFLVTALSLAEQEWLQLNDTFKMGVDPSWPPLDFIDADGFHSGISADYIDVISDSLNVKFIVDNNLTWSEVLRGFKNNTIDILPSIIKTAQRTKEIALTDTYISLPTVLVTHKGTFYAENLKTLANKKLGMGSGYAYVELIARDYPDIQIVTFNSPTEGLKSLLNGEIDAFLDAQAIIQYQFNKLQTVDLIIDSFTPYKVDIVLGVRKELKALVPIINKVLASMSAKEKSIIKNNWLSVNLSTGTDLNTILKLGIPPFLILVFIIIFIIRLNRGMQHEIKQRLQSELSLEQAKEKAEQATQTAIKANKAKSDFLANVSHEIRTPMNAVLGMSHLLEESGLNEEQQDYLDILKTSSSTLLMLINDILDLSKIESGKFELENRPFVLEQIINSVSQQILLLIRQDKVTYTIELSKDIPIVLSGDSLRLGQILLNILNNASKFTQSGSITLKISLLEQNEQFVKLCFNIIDTGIGMSADQQQKLFKTYTQADSSTTRKYGGTGLGLTISKSLTELMNGGITVDSVEGKGSTFSVTLCLDKAKSDHIDTMIIKNKLYKSTKAEDKYESSLYDKFPSLVGKSILLVDDNKVNLMVAYKILKKAGLEIVTAVNGLEALKKVEQSAFDLVLMDIQMPVMDGYTATEQLRAHPEFHKLPIVALSANVMPEDMKKSKSVGMNAHLPKPLNVKLLLETLDRLI